MWAVRRGRTSSEEIEPRYNKEAGGDAVQPAEANREDIVQTGCLEPAGV